VEYVEPEDTGAVDPLANEEAAEEEEAFEDGEEKPTPPTGGQDGSSSSPSLTAIGAGYALLRRSTSSTNAA